MILIARFVCEKILRPHLFLDLIKSLTQFAFVTREERTSAGAFRDLVQRAFIDTAVEAVSNTDGIDDRLGSYSCIDRVIKAVL